MKKNLSETITENSEMLENAILGYINNDNAPYQELIRSMKYSLLSGGKRIRPFLTLEFAKMLGGGTEKAMPYAVAIEMIHTYSLIHDDLPCMDNDDMRRGKPTNHKCFGEATALLAGDSLLTYAFSVAVSNDRLSAAQNCEAVKLLSENAGYNGMAGGQLLDLLGEREKLSQDSFLLMNRLKTGCLIKTACLLGCISAGFGIGTKEYEGASVYAENIGLAFQIEDDILDYGTEDNKTTFLSFMTADEAKSKVDELTQTAIAAISVFENNETLIAFAEHLSKRTV